MSPDELETFIIRKHEQTSNWDSSTSRIDISDIDALELEKYISRAVAAGRLDYSYTHSEDILERLDLKDNGMVKNAAEVMFSKRPRLAMQMATFASKEKLTFNDINHAEGRVLDLVDIGERYIRNTMRYRVIIDGTQISRKEIPEVPHVAIREALLNSFCHKNYRTPQTNEIAIFSDRIEIYNPGTFPVGITPDDYIKGKGRTIHRNPLLALIMYYSKDIEKFGTGLKRIADACNEAGVKYEFVSDNYGFTVIFYRPPLWTSDRLEDNIRSSVGAKDVINTIDKDSGFVTTDNVAKNVVLTDIEKEVIQILTNNRSITAEKLAIELSVTQRTIQRHLKVLQDKNIIIRNGSRKSGYWDFP
jgi:ATP-dependent DNA helicase RecG